MADLLIAAVLIPGKSAPKLILSGTIGAMKKGSVFVDVAIDQGGSAETSRATSHSQPVLEVDGVLHYCVPNIPALVPRASTFALTNATLPYLLDLANHGPTEALRRDGALRRGLNAYSGAVSHPGVAESQGRTCHEFCPVDL